MEEPHEKRSPAASLTDELLVEILRRLPVRSVSRFKCVSRSWRKLISDPGYRNKLPQTLVGFFYESLSGERFPCVAHHFTNVTRKGVPFIYPSFSFLPVCSSDVILLDCCNGLLLCRCLQPGPRDSEGKRPFYYAVCNPATEKWVMFQISSWASGEVRTARLGFDPAVSSHFHVIEYVEDEDDYITGVDIYSSKTGSWNSMVQEVSLLMKPEKQEASSMVNGCSSNKRSTRAVLLLQEERRDDMPEMERRKKISSTRADLSVDPVGDILSRLPVKSLCRFKCVWRHWHALCSDPRRGRRNLPRTLFGFFYQSISGGRFPARHFASVVSGDEGRRAPLVEPALSFQHGAERTSLVDCCSGLLLCRRWEGPSCMAACGLVLFNPAVERWAALPESASAHGARTVCLAFDPVVSSHFNVLAFLEDESYYVTGMEIYSSFQTGGWSRKESGWSGQTTLRGDARSAFFNGMLHLVVQGKTWRTIVVPPAARYRCKDCGNVIASSSAYHDFMLYRENHPSTITR
ncbi:hypothetical protein BAE44_0006539 [Dichanthelium oligosanthes]|uniref:F-box domain-containing protein n=1 Tax=Dichanthelium oligosanthes TaxID=888268 RepID=A0A1E5W4T0_9POAL|nr:hypothetical protein BAE44_0006539 [Dichanthelium oligosanthes]